MTSRYLAPFQPPSRTLAGGDLLSDLYREMNRLLEDFAGSGAPGTGGLMQVPRVDVRENEQELCVCAELPGIPPDAVDVRIDGHLLTLRGEKKDESRQQHEDYHLMERSFGRFQRSLQLPFAPEPEQVRAEFEHGVLTVHLPKQSQQSRSRRVEVHAQPSHGKAQPQVTTTPGASGSHH
ncbi:Hsp20/alpha crystallin family protein [Ramlibacter sp. MAHUQ-53]|uniref:Hsp20/alpha crystallin family protein n=1 Tax=unclassified Ramlibacter TaxID=2617605 RepID=UPI00363A2A94